MAFRGAASGSCWRWVRTRAGAARAAISVWPGMGRDAGRCGSWRNPRLHERDPPPAADPADHAGRDPGQCTVGLSVDLWRAGARRGWSCSAPGLPPRSSISLTFIAALWFATPPPAALAKVSRARTRLAHRLGADAPIARRRRRSRSRFGAGARAALRRGAVDGVDSALAAPAAHQVATAGHGHPVHGAAFGIALAATVRVGHAVGRNDAAGGETGGAGGDAARNCAGLGARRSPWSIARRAIARLFGGASDGAGAAVELTATLLLVGATFFVTDAGFKPSSPDCPAAMNDTRIPLLLAAIGYWIDRVSLRLWGRIFGAARRRRGVDRTVRRDRDLRRSADLAVSAAGRQAGDP